MPSAVPPQAAFLSPPVTHQAVTVRPPPPLDQSHLTFAISDSNNLAGLVFVLHSSTNLAVKLCDWPAEILPGTNRLLVITNDAPQKFFYLTASNTGTGLESPP